MCNVLYIMCNVHNVSAIRCDCIMYIYIYIYLMVYHVMSCYTELTASASLSLYMSMRVCVYVVVIDVLLCCWLLVFSCTACVYYFECLHDAKRSVGRRRILASAGAPEMPISLMCIMSLITIVRSISSMITSSSSSSSSSSTTTTIIIITIITTIIIIAAATRRSARVPRRSGRPPACRASAGTCYVFMCYIICIYVYT